mmetsp:Transcript_40203/g.113678  ORF Transcript_40203/g.113678 Transcript_40203/m.113678 type:complete len:239 (-) Transcript_40203:304-1020(-)
MVLFSFAKLSACSLKRPASWANSGRLPCPCRAGASAVTASSASCFLHPSTRSRFPSASTFRPSFSCASPPPRKFRICRRSLSSDASMAVTSKRSTASTSRPLVTTVPTFPAEVYTCRGLLPCSVRCSSKPHQIRCSEDASRSTTSTVPSCAAWTALQNGLARSPGPKSSPNCEFAKVHTQIGTDVARSSLRATSFTMAMKSRNRPDQEWLNSSWGFWGPAATNSTQDNLLRVPRCSST